MAVTIIIVALSFVRYFNSYEAPGDHWAPASPITHETARFITNMGAGGDYHISVEKMVSKFPLLFVEYQPPGLIVETTIHSDDGIILLNQRFADEGHYRITVQHTVDSNNNETIDFIVQTPLFKYADDLFLFVCLLLAGWISGRRLQQLFPVAMLLLVLLVSTPHSASAHGEHNSTYTPLSVGTQSGSLTLSWLHHHPPHGFANNAPLDWSIQLGNATHRIGNIPFLLEIIHSETHFPVLTLSGVATDGTIPLRYSPPDGTDYQLRLQTAVDGKLHHFTLDATAQPIQPTAQRKWQSFAIMLIPLLIGMGWGWHSNKKNS